MTGLERCGAVVLTAFLLGVVLFAVVGGVRWLLF